MPTDRGEYRPMFCRILNGPDFRRLGGVARACIWPLKLRLPVTGIGVIPALVGTLSEDTGFPEESIRSALEELEAEEAGGAWVRRQGNVVWLVRGLEFEPTINPNDPRHMTHLRRIVDGLPSLEIVESYKAHYSNWFTPPRQTPGEPQPSETLDPDQGSNPGSGQGSDPESGQGPTKGDVSTTPTPTPTPTTKKTHTSRRRADSGYSPEFESARSAYPKRPNDSKAEAWRAWLARLREGELPVRMHAGIVAFAAYVQREGTEPRFVKHMATFLGPDRHYLNDFGPPVDDAPEPEIVFADQMPGAAERAAAFAAARDAALAGVTRG